MRGNIKLAIGVIFLIVFSLTVWPGMYRYDHIKFGERNFPVRINRVTGYTEILYPSGWKEARQELINVQQQPRFVLESK